MDLEILATKMNPEERWGWCDYTPIIEGCGEVLLRKDQDDHQGDTWAILKGSDGRLGYLKFGWGSCSGCDALQAASNWKEVCDLAVSIEQDVKWFDSPDALGVYLRDHDWEGDYCWGEGGFKAFLAEARSLFPAN